MKSHSLLEPLLRRALSKMWREVGPYEIIKAAQIDESLYAFWQFEFSDNGLLIKIRKSAAHPEDKIVLTLLVVERGECGQDSPEFKMGLLETDLILGRIEWICSLQISLGQVMTARVVTEACGLREIVDEPNWSKCLDNEEYSRLVGLCGALQMNAEKQVAQSG